MSRRHLAFWVTTIPVSLAFAFSGIANLAHLPHIARDMAHLGYPPYFSSVLGAWKVLGAIAVATPGFQRLKEWAYAGMMFDLTGAAVSRGVMGDGATGIAPPLIIALLVICSWALRSSDDKGASHESVSSPYDRNRAA